MSNRLKLCTAIRAAKMATIDDLCELIPMWHRKKVQDTVKDCVVQGYILRKRDDVTGMPAYELTAKGKGFCSATPADGGANNIRSSVSAPPSEAVSLSAEDTAGHETTGGEGNASPVAVDIMPTDKACCNAAKVMATTAGHEVTALRDQRAILDEALTTAQKTIAALEENLKQANGEREYMVKRIREALCIDNAPEAGIVPTIEQMLEHIGELDLQKQNLLDALCTSTGLKDAAEAQLRSLTQRAEAAEANRNDIAQVRDSLGKSIVSFCEWMSEHFACRVPMNLKECRHFLKDMKLADKSQAETTSTAQTGYTISEIEHDDLGIVTHNIDHAKTNAVIATLKTGKRHGVFALVDRVESVNVEWAA